MITIKLYEENNKFISKEPYSPVVCGNSNYCIEFAFGSDWESAKMKLAVFICDGEKTVVDFTGNILNLPAMPNCNKFSFFLISKSAENKQLISAPCEILAIPTTNADNMSEFKPITSFVSELLTKLQNLADGTTKVKNAELADTATTAKNTSNPNLLLNGDFRINQRGKTSYTSDAIAYTVDRWKTNVSNKDITTTITPKASGINISYTGGSSGHSVFMQELEPADISLLKGKTLTLSYKVCQLSNSCRIRVVAGSNTVILTESINDSGVFSQTFVCPETATGLSVRIISNSPENSVDLEYIKLELGSNPTTFTPRPYAEELALCQRYFYKFCASQTYTNMGICCTSWTAKNFASSISVPQQLRTYPTITMQGSFRIAYDNTTEDVLSISRSSYDTQQIGLIFVVESGKSWTMGLLQSNNDNTARIEFDAEIY